MVDLWATVHGERVVLRGGVKSRPLAWMVKAGPSLSSSWRGMMRTIRPSSTSTCTGPPVVRFVSRRVPAIDIALVPVMPVGTLSLQSSDRQFADAVNYLPYASLSR